MKIQTYIWPDDATVFQPDGATIPFVKYVENGETIIGFDSQMCIPPEPMVNAMIALKMLDTPHVKVIMVNHRSPVGLLAKVAENYEINEEKLEGEAVKLTFSYKEGATEQADLSNSRCGG